MTVTPAGIIDSLILWVDFAVVLVNWKLFSVMRRWGRAADADEPARSEVYMAAREWRA